MTAITSFVRKTPAASLRTYFDRSGIELRPAVDWDAPEADVVRALLLAVEDLVDSVAARVVSDAERVTAMADEAGQAAIYSVAQAPERLDGLRNDHDRALWMFLHDAAGFRHAEEVRFTDDRRRGRMWDGFLGEPNLILKRDAVSIDAFKAAIRDRFQSNNVHVDIFDRHRATFEGADCVVAQATVYREGRPDDFFEFVNGALDRRPRRPVFEAAITYEPATGVIEVVANDRESREDKWNDLRVVIGFEGDKPVILGKWLLVPTYSGARCNLVQSIFFPLRSPATPSLQARTI